MCGECCREGQHHEHHGYGICMGYHMPLMDVDEEIKMLEESKEALNKRLEKVNKRLEALKR